MADSQDETSSVDPMLIPPGPPPADDDDNDDDVEGGDTSDGDAHSLNLPPGRMKAIRVPERLSSSSPMLSNSHLRKRLSLTGTNESRSRSRSPSMVGGKTSSTPSTFDANSSISSLEDIIDQDILYDRQGLVELDMSDSRKFHSSREFINLPPVSERLSEDSLEDTRAFSDVMIRSSNASRVSVGTGTDAVLEPLDECGEEDEDDLDDIDEEEDVPGMIQSTIILTNMENLTLLPPDTQAASRTGESSVGYEAPSAPTA